MSGTDWGRSGAEAVWQEGVRFALAKVEEALADGASAEALTYAEWSGYLDEERGERVIILPDHPGDARWRDERGCGAHRLSAPDGDGEDERRWSILSAWRTEAGPMVEVIGPVPAERSEVLDRLWERLTEG